MVNLLTVIMQQLLVYSFITETSAWRMNSLNINLNKPYSIFSNSLRDSTLSSSSLSVFHRKGMLRDDMKDLDSTQITTVERRDDGPRKSTKMNEAESNMGKFEFSRLKRSDKLLFDYRGKKSNELGNIMGGNLRASVKAESATKNLSGTKARNMMNSGNQRETQINVDSKVGVPIMAVEPSKAISSMKISSSVKKMKLNNAFVGEETVEAIKSTYQRPVFDDLEARAKAKSFATRNSLSQGIVMIDNFEDHQATKLPNQLGSLSQRTGRLVSKSFTSVPDVMSAPPYPPLTVSTSFSPLGDGSGVVYALLLGVIFVGMSNGDRNYNLNGVDEFSKELNSSTSVSNFTHVKNSIACNNSFFHKNYEKFSTLEEFELTNLEKVGNISSVVADITEVGKDSEAIGAMRTAGRTDDDEWKMRVLPRFPKKPILTPEEQEAAENARQLKVKQGEEYKKMASLEYERRKLEREREKQARIAREKERLEQEALEKEQKAYLDATSVLPLDQATRKASEAAKAARGKAKEEAHRLKIFEEIRLNEKTKQRIGEGSGKVDGMKHAETYFEQKIGDSRLKLKHEVNATLLRAQDKIRMGALEGGRKRLIVRMKTDQAFRGAAKLKASQEKMPTGKKEPAEGKIIGAKNVEQLRIMAVLGEKTQVRGDMNGRVKKERHIEVGDEHQTKKGKCDMKQKSVAMNAQLKRRASARGRASQGGAGLKTMEEVGTRIDGAKEIVEPKVVTERIMRSVEKVGRTEIVAEIVKSQFHNPNDGEISWDPSRLTRSSSCASRSAEDPLEQFDEVDPATCLAEGEESKEVNVFINKFNSSWWLMKIIIFVEMLLVECFGKVLESIKFPRRPPYNAVGDPDSPGKIRSKASFIDLSSKNLRSRLVRKFMFPMVTGTMRYLRMKAFEIHEALNHQNLPKGYEIMNATLAAAVHLVTPRDLRFPRRISHSS